MIAWDGRCCSVVMAMKARAVAGRGGGSPLCGPGSELLLEGSARVVRG